MKRFALMALALVAAVVLFAGCGGDRSYKVKYITGNGCAPTPHNSLTDSGVVKVDGHQCIEAWDDASVVASGNAVVSAHGNSNVNATGHVQLFVYNREVSCSISGPYVTIIYNDQVRQDANAGLRISCRR